MKPLSTLTDAQLKFHVQDAESAVKANPRNPKAIQYLEELHACEIELQRRELLRSLRRTARDLHDPLSIPRNFRRAWRVHYSGSPAPYVIPTWKRQDAKAAAYRLAFVANSKPQ